jgi:predicted PurR-regulated permease PerM
MDALSLFLLGIIATAAVVQTGFLISLLREGRRTARQLDAFTEKLGRELEPSLQDLSRASRNLAEVSERAASQARRVDDLVSEGMGVAEKALRVAQGILLPVGGRIAALAVTIRILKRARRATRFFRRLVS